VYRRGETDRVPDQAIVAFVPIADDIADTTPPTDEDLVAGLDAGGSEVLAELYARHASAVFAIAARALDAAAAEDVVQEVFLVVWRQAHTFDPARGSVRAWVIRIAQSRVANELRRRRRRPLGEGDPDGRIVESVRTSDRASRTPCGANFAAVRSAPRSTRCRRRSSAPSASRTSRT